MRKHRHDPLTDPGCMANTWLRLSPSVRESGEDKRFEGDALDYRS